MKVYVSSHDYIAARYTAKLLQEAGYTVVSTWHKAAPAHNRTNLAKKSGAERNVKQIKDADCLVLVSAHDKVPGGKFVEAGVAIGQGKQVYVIGRRENNLLFHGNVKDFSTPEELVNFLESEAPVAAGSRW